MSSCAIGWDGVLVWSLDERRRLVPAPVVNVFESGVKDVYRVRLASGREVKATANHPFLTFSGWTPLGDLSARRPGGDTAARARAIWPDSAGLSTASGFWPTSSVTAASSGSSPSTTPRTTRENLAFVEEAAAAEFGISPRRVAQEDVVASSYLPAPERCTHGRGNPIHDWFRELGIEYRGARDKRIPELLHSASDDEIALFVRHLWATDGCVWPSRDNSAAKVYYASSSRELADGVTLLLSRLGIVARIRQVEKAGYEPGYHVIVADTPSLRIFCERVGVHGHRAEAAT